MGQAGTPALTPGARHAPRGAEHPFFPQIQVFHLGEGIDSKNWMSRNKGDTGTMYLKHIKEVLGFIATQYWGLRVLMWDDMLRKISVGALRGERMGTAVLAPKPGVSAAPVCMTTLTRCLAEACAWPRGDTGSGEQEEPQASSCRWHRCPCPRPCCPHRVWDSKARVTRGVVLCTRL